MCSNLVETKFIDCKCLHIYQVGVRVQDVLPELAALLCVRMEQVRLLHRHGFLRRSVFFHYHCLSLSFLVILNFIIFTRVFMVGYVLSICLTIIHCGYYINFAPLEKLCRLMSF